MVATAVTVWCSHARAAGVSAEDCGMPKNVGAHGLPSRTAAHGLLVLPCLPISADPIATFKLPSSSLSDALTLAAVTCRPHVGNTRPGFGGEHWIWLEAVHPMPVL